jgi:hypothetical protein
VEWADQPSKVFDLTLPLDRVAEGYRAMGPTTRDQDAARAMRSFPTMNLVIALAGTIALACSDETDVAGQEATTATSSQLAKTMKIRMGVEGTVITATLDDNATARDFVSLLPLTLTLQDYAATEKVSDLPRKLTTVGAPPGSKPSSGDITYYSPWGNLALFHKSAAYASGLVRLGKFDSGVDALRRPGSLRVSIELVGE